MITHGRREQPLDQGNRTVKDHTPFASSISTGPKLGLVEEGGRHPEVGWRVGVQVDGPNIRSQLELLDLHKEDELSRLCTREIAPTSPRGVIEVAEAVYVSGFW